MTTKGLKRILLGLDGIYETGRCKIRTLRIPDEDGRPTINIEYRADEGLVIYLLRRIMKIEEEMREIKLNKINK